MSGFESMPKEDLKTWIDLVDSSLGENENAIRDILQKAVSKDNALRMIADYMHDGHVTQMTERDSAEKLGTKMPEFKDEDEETLWNLFVNFRSDLT